MDLGLLNEKCTDLLASIIINRASDSMMDSLETSIKTQSIGKNIKTNNF